MKYSELVKILIENGCYFLRHASNHDIWVNPNDKKFPVPRHWGKEVATSTLNDILKQAGIKKR